MKKILVVEDEFLLALDLTQQLEDAGFEVEGPVAQVSHALILIDSQPPDLALLDIDLGRGRTSHEIARRLTKRGIPFAFISGQTKGLEEFSSVPLLPKPFAIKRVLEVIGSVLAPRGMSAAAAERS
jgi:DNA-binding response OmpR family regulator